MQISNQRTALSQIKIILIGTILTLSIFFLAKNQVFSQNEKEIPTKQITEKKKEAVSANSKKTIITQKKQILTPTFIPTSTPTMTPTPTMTITPEPTNSPTNEQFATDTIAPHTNLYYPAQNGEITFKIDGKVCAIQTAPTDDQSNHNEIGVAYRFDDDAWSDFEIGKGYLCKESLPNGSHILQVKAKDKAGNIEPEQTFSFTVNIENN